LVCPALVRTSVRGIKYLASSHTSHCTPSLWRWKWYRVPKRRPTIIWRRGNTQKKIYNIQITAKVWNQGNNIVIRRTRLIQWKEGGPPHNTVHMDIQPTLHPDSPYIYGQK